MLVPMVKKELSQKVKLSIYRSIFVSSTFSHDSENNTLLIPSVGWLGALSKTGLGAWSPRGDPSGSSIWSECLSGEVGHVASGRDSGEDSSLDLSAGMESCLDFAGGAGGIDQERSLWTCLF